MQGSTYQDHLAELLACQLQTVGDDWKTIRIAPDGEVTSRKGTFLIDDDSARAIVADFDQHGTPLVIDWEHQTLGGAYSAPDGRAPAAGWIRKLWREAGRGLYALVKWNDKARDAIKAEEYLYLSPVLSIRESDRRAVALHSAALTNKPAIPRMERLAASDRITNTEGNPMATEMTPDVKELLGKIGVAMQCDVSDDLVGSLNAILAKAQTVMGGDEGTADTAVALAASVRAAFKLNAKAGDEELLATLNSLKDVDVVVMRAELTAAKTELAEMRFTIAMHPHLQAGRIHKDDAKGIAVMRDLYTRNPDTFEYVMQGRSGPPQGQTVAPSAQTCHRDKIITDARRTFDSDRQLGRLTSARAYVNDQLRESKLEALSNEELVAFKIQ